MDLALHGMWDLSSRTGNRTQAPFTVKQILNHWTTRKSPLIGCLSNCSYYKEQNSYVIFSFLETFPCTVWHKEATHIFF